MKKETLSELIDGELQSQELESALDNLLSDPELQNAWRSAHSARAALDDHCIVASPYLYQNIVSSLEKELDIVAPDNIATGHLASDSADSFDAQSAVGDHIVPIKRGRSKVMAYLAVAASVVAVTMITYNPLEKSTASIAANEPASPISIQPGVQQELQSMIVQHGEFSGAAALNGLVAYAKVVNGSTAPSIR